MRFSKLFGKTLKEIPSEADTLSHQLLLRAGMIQQVAAGVYSYLPLGWRVLRKIEQIIREEMDTAGGQELMLPALQPMASLWLNFNKHYLTIFETCKIRIHSMIFAFEDTIIRFS